MEKEILKPAKEGMVVRDPISFLPLKQEGEEKLMSSFWVRRKMHGDVVEVVADKDVEKNAEKISEKNPEKKNSKKVSET